MGLPAFDHDSEQVEKIRSLNFTMLRPYDIYGRKRISYGNVPDGTVFAADDVIGILKIKKDCRILPGILFFGAMGASITADVGVVAQDGTGFIDKAGTIADDPDYFTDAPIDVSAAGSAAFADTIGENVGVIFEKDVILTVALTGGTPAVVALRALAQYVND